MDKARLQFWNVLRYLSTFLYFIFGVLAVVDFAGLMPDGLGTYLESYLDIYLKSILRAYSVGFVPPQLIEAWIPLVVATVLFVFVARISSRRKRLWRPSGFEAVPAPNGGYLQKASSVQLKKELAKAALEAGLKAKESLRMTEMSQIRLKAGREARGQAKKSFKLAERHFAENRYRDAAAEYQKSASSFATMSAYLNMGVSFCYVSYFEKAVAAFDKGTPIAQRNQNDNFMAAFLCNICIPHRELGALTEAYACFKQAYGIGGKYGDSLGQACALGNLGNLLLLQGRPDEALRSWQKALESFEQTNCRAGRAAALDSIGSVYSGKRNFKQALNYHQKARKIYKSIYNLPGELHALANIGYVYFKLDKRWKSLRTSRKAFKLAVRLGSFLDRARTLGNIGLANGKKKSKLEEALRSVQRAMELYEKIDNPLGVGNQLANIGVIYAAQKKKKEALKKLGEARAKFLEIGAKCDGFQTAEAGIQMAFEENTYW